QGLYIYRNGRLLQAGGWHSLLPDSRSDWQLARVSIDLDQTLLGAVALNPEKRGVVLRPDFIQALESASADDGTTFRQFLEHARETTQAANTRRTGPKPITSISNGLSEQAREAVHEILGTRDGVVGASILWHV